MTKPTTSELGEILSMLVTAHLMPGSCEFTPTSFARTIQAIEQKYIRREDLAELIGNPKLGDFEVSTKGYSDVIKCIKWYKNRIKTLNLQSKEK